MVDFDILRPGMWFGPKPLHGDDSFEHVSDETELLLKICTRMKVGDFSIRSKLQDLIISSKNSAVRQQAIRLFCYTSRHKDIEFIGNLLSRLNHDDVLTVVVTAPDTLSQEIIPFLFALLGEYEETSIVPDILTAINRLFPWGYDDGDVDLIWLASHFAGFAKELVPGAYYYAGVLAHPGNLCKSLIETAMHAKQGNSKFPLANIPILLSTWSGERCPVYYGDLIDDVKMQSVFDYVSCIAKMPWEHGVKYFYGHEIG